MSAGWPLPSTGATLAKSASIGATNRLTGERAAGAAGAGRRLRRLLDSDRPDDADDHQDRGDRDQEERFIGGSSRPAPGPA